MKSKLLLPLLICFFAIISTVNGQAEILIRDFSPEYYGKVKLEAGQDNEVFKKGTVFIYSHRSKRAIIEVDSDELTFDLDPAGKIKTNVLELPYGEQSLLIYDDFNFDGENDLAVLEGQNSCYHGPSYKIFLSEGNRLKLSPKFTRLAQNYCGMFDVDHETKTIHTMTKSGCCWHEYSTFIVDGTTPMLKSRTEVNHGNYFVVSDLTIYGIDGKAREAETFVDLKESSFKEYFSFQLLGDGMGGKRVTLGATEEKKLIYFLFDESRLSNFGDFVEFAFPEDFYEVKPESNPAQFTFDATQDRLNFRNYSYKYEIYLKRLNGKVSDVGIIVRRGDAEFKIKGDPNTIKGSLEDIRTSDLNNVFKAPGE